MFFNIFKKSKPIVKNGLSVMRPNRLMVNCHLFGSHTDLFLKQKRLIQLKKRG